MATATSLDKLKLDVEHAEAIIEKAIEFEIHSEGMPDSKKAKISTAADIVALAVDAWVTEGIKPGEEGGDQVAEILELAGVSIDKKDKVKIGVLPELEDDEEEDDDDEIDEDDEDEDDDDDDDDDEDAFDPDDYIEGYSELSATSKVKAVKKLDAEDEDDQQVILLIQEWENAQDKPASKVLTYIDSLFEDDEEDEDEDDEEEIEDDEDDSEDEDDSDDDDDDEDEEIEEPWEGYDVAKVADIKEVIFDDERTAEEVEAIRDYENSRPRPRTRVVKYCEDALAEFEGAEDEDDDDEDEAPAKSAKKGKGKSAPVVTAEDAQDAINTLIAFINQA